MSKVKEFSHYGKRFMQSLIKGLQSFEIETSNIWLSKAKRRNKDNKDTSYISFGIKQRHVNKFIKEIGWLK